MKIIFLGTSGTVPTGQRNHSAIVLEYLDEYFLFDCGEGTQRQLRIAGVNPMKFDNIFITHLHADHILGLGGLIQSLDFMDRKRTLDIWGPKGMQRVIDQILNTGTFRLSNFDVKVHEIEGGEILRGPRYKISCVPTRHTTNSYGYCFEETSKRKFLKEKALQLGVPEGPLFSRLQKGKSVEVNKKVINPDDVLDKPIPGRKIVYTGDTIPCDQVVELAKNCDVLIHDSTFSHELVDKATDMGHSTTQQAAEVAKKANVKKLYLTHISQRYTEPKKLEREARKVFEHSRIAEDFMVVEIEKHW